MPGTWPPYLTVLFAFLLDQLLGDPVFRLHPVRLIGKTAELLRPALYPLGRLGGLLVLLTTASLWGLLSLLAQGVWALEVIFLYFWLAEASLRREVEKVAYLLKEGALPQARKALSFLVGRETKRLSPSECIRALIETAAENFTDALVGPLFWYLVAGLPGATVYKVVETLDSMYGYKTRRWQAFGFFPARADDLLNFVPARLAGLLLALTAWFSGYPLRRTLETMWRDARNHDSPNAGFTEAAMAGALGIELGGRVVYEGIVFEKGRFGKPLKEREVEDIFRATKLLRRAALLWLLFILALEVLLWRSGYPHLSALIMNGLKSVLTA